MMSTNMSSDTTAAPVKAPSSVNSKDLLNLTQLRAFRLVADMGSATRAAAALFRAQSAVTRSVQELDRRAHV